ncbi:MAG: glycosyltransferase family 4 protein [Bradyrhizobium sp.]|uniref:glycosyltransferase family 4 protein n=1 Tax=Bradyrhizobium sp. TaxID=376 RepID=UPI001D1B3900|nr:glycosyltransferase family 4 protein [Bradyrhizobium sp.]MBV9561738.1 glycosyltransferase family 4 protein [Bradyrhizobium sp.]
MRILHLVNHCNHANGNAHVAVDLACVQAERGHDVAYVSAGGDYEGLLRNHGVSFGLVTLNGRNPLALLRSLIVLRRFCMTFKPDIIHAHMMASAVFGYLASRLCRVPLVTTVHNSFDRHSVLMRLGDKVVAVSEAERKFLRGRGFGESQLAVVINGPNHSPREDYLSDKNSVDATLLHRPYVVTVCGLHRRKGVHDLLRGYAAAIQGQPEWRLCIVGEGPDRAELTKLATDLGIGDKVEFFGAVGNPRQILENADIFVLASYADPCSLAVAEAREAGCAIVATAVGGTPELLEFGKAGELVPAGSPADIAQKLVTLMSDPALLQTARARSKAGSEYFRVTRAAADYEAVYASLTGVARAPEKLGLQRI